VDMGGTVNTVKNGSTVPLKFNVYKTLSGEQITDVSAIQGFTVRTVNCSTSAETDAMEFTTTGGTSLRYDTTEGQFIQNWRTPKSPGSCYKVTMTTLDGSSLTALFKSK
ncbi:MAG: PxKF domain-containing protein, partial [Candidatus Nanopelagicales bacterium]